MKHVTLAASTKVLPKHFRDTTIEDLMKDLIDDAHELMEDVDINSDAPRDVLLITLTGEIEMLAACFGLEKLTEADHE